MEYDSLNILHIINIILYTSYKYHTFVINLSLTTCLFLLKFTDSVYLGSIQFFYFTFWESVQGYY